MISRTFFDFFKLDIPTMSLNSLKQLKGKLKFSCWIRFNLLKQCKWHIGFYKIRESVVVNL